MSQLPYLRQLEAESIYIFREVAAEFRKPVKLFSIGKDSAEPPRRLIDHDPVSSFARMRQDGCF